VLLERAPYFLSAGHDDGQAQVSAAARLASGPQPRWAVDPAQPGPDLPLVGRSLFDFAMTREVAGKAVYDIPYPFAALVHKVEQQAGCADHEGGCIKQVLIPLGRSLQRIAASPDFFAFPRVVVAVDGEGASGLLLKDRLYIGYQEKSNLLEVIGYNEAAGRFEFQIVQDYRAGGRPRVVYANRTVCSACHQNLAPLFSRQQWDETNANPAVAQRLAAVKPSFYGFPARRDIETPNAIDAAIHRANLLSVYQTLWREGCGEDPQTRLACRRAALIAALQYRLSGERAFDAESPTVNQSLVAALSKSLTARWPHGMAIPNSEIPNRDPLTYRTDAQGVAITHIAAGFEPLAVRGPLEVWDADGAANARRLAAGLAQMFSEQDMRLLDQELAQRAGVARIPSRAIDARCNVSETPTDVGFHCAAGEQAGMRLDGRVSLQGARVDSGELASLQLDGAPPLRVLTISQGHISHAAGTGVLSFSPTVAGRRARLASGDAIESIELRWQSGAQGEAKMVVREDFVPLRDAIAGADAELLSTPAFARAEVMAWLTAKLGVNAPSSCCTRTDALPAAQEDSNRSMTSEVPEMASAFKKACAACHATAERSPPNFLYGDARRVSAAVRSCAARMYVRLSMWGLDRTQREKVPMPPPRAAHDGTPPDQEYGPRPEMLETLKRAAADILRKETGAAPDLRSLLDGGYENLPACLPAGA
jgi:mono/diheme cytochrome c family protein